MAIVDFRGAPRGREHDTSALREHAEILPLLTAWTDEHLRVLGDLGYEGEAETITVAFKKPKHWQLTADSRRATAPPPAEPADTFSPLKFVDPANVTGR